MSASFRAFVANLIDYAGLFPPAKLEMRPAVESYLRYRAGDLAWMLGPFICPVSRFEEFNEALVDVAGDDTLDTPIAISAIPSGDEMRESLDAIFDFEDAHEGTIVVPMIETKVASVDDIESIDCMLPEGMQAAFEIPLDRDFRGLITAIAGTGHAAKIRTGGLEPNAFPSIETVAKFISTCYQASVPFKATAGLHHPLRHHAESVGCKMHGFFNVFGAAIACRTHQLEEAALLDILESESAADFEFNENVMTVCGQELTTDDIADARAHFALSYGSCSFEEPINDLKSLNLID